MKDTNAQHTPVFDQGEEFNDIEDAELTDSVFADYIGKWPKDGSTMPEDAVAHFNSVVGKDYSNGGVYDTPIVTVEEFLENPCLDDHGEQAVTA